MITTPTLDHPKNLRSAAGNMLDSAFLEADRCTALANMIIDHLDDDYHGFCKIESLVTAIEDRLRAMALEVERNYHLGIAAQSKNNAKPANHVPAELCDAAD